MMPTAVAQKAERANELLKSAALARSGSARQDEPPPAAAPAAAPAPAADVAKLQADLAQASKDLETERRKYAVLRGKYDAEVPDLTRQVKELTARVEAAEANLKQKVEAGEVSSLNDDERQLAGPDLLKVIAKTAREVAGQEVDARVATHLKPLADKVNAFEQQTEADYYATLDEGVPGWNQPGSVNDDPTFLNWLQELDQATGRTRWDLLKRAEAAKQGRRVVEVFKAFLEKREIGASQPAPQPKPVSPSPAAPAAAADASAQAGNEKKIWTRAEIQNFYRTKRTDAKYKGKAGEAKAREIELDITAAYAEGRIRG